MFLGSFYLEDELNTAFFIYIFQILETIMIKIFLFQYTRFVLKWRFLENYFYL